MLPFAFGLLLWRQRQSVFTNPWSCIGASMVALVVLAAQALHSAVKELCAVTAVVCDVMDDVGDGDLAFGEADFAQWLLRELEAPASAPSAIVVGATTGIAANAAALGVKRIG